CLLNGLSGPDFSVCEMVDEDGQRVCVVSSRTLKPWLERQVPQWLATVSLTLNQNPDLRVESQRPKDLARLPSMPPEALRTRGPSRVPSPQPATDVLRGLAEDHGIGAYFASEIGVRSPIHRPSRETSRGFNDDMDRLLATRGRESFET